MNLRSLRFRLVTWYALWLGAVFIIAGAPRFFVETGESLAPALIELRRLLISLALGSVVVAGMALGGGFLLVRRALRPVEEITRRAERITSRNLSERLPELPTGDEFEH